MLQLDPENKIISLCAGGMTAEGEGKTQISASMYKEAWEAASSNMEKYIAAHYVARLQDNATEKLKWDEIALSFALKVEDEGIKAHLPSLYLNIGKCYEDLQQVEQARKSYEAAASFSGFLPADGYGKMIMSGIKSGLDRILNPKASI